MNPENIDWNEVIADSERQLREIDVLMIDDPFNKKLIKYRKKVEHSLDAALQMRDTGTYGVFGKMGTAIDSGSESLAKTSEGIKNTGDSMVKTGCLITLWIFAFPIMLPIWLIKITFFNKSK